MIWVQIEAKLDSLLAGASEAECASIFNQFRKTFDTSLGFPARNEIAKTPNDLAGANGLFGGAIQGVFQFRSVGIGTRCKKAARTFHVIADGGQRLIKLVGECRCHFSHRAQTRNVNEFGLQLLKPRLGLLMFRQIADKAGEVGHSAGLHFANRKMHRESRSVLALTGYDSSDADDMPLAGRSVACHVSVVARAIGVWHQDTDVLADGLLFRIAELPLRGTAEELHDAVAVDDDHRIRDCFQDRLQMTLARSKRLFELLLLVDVERDPAEMTGHALLVLDQAATEADPMGDAGR